jgi:chromosomal replication initiation ATPase DnaA
MRKVRETVAAGSERELARGIVRKPPVTSPALKRASRVSEGLALRPIIARVGEAFGIPERLLRRPERTVTAVSEVRELVVWVLREAVPHPVPSFPVIGLALGGRDHSTIISAYRKAVARVDADPALRARLIALGCEASGLRSAA